MLCHTQAIHVSVSVRLLGVKCAFILLRISAMVSVCVYVAVSVCFFMYLHVGVDVAVCMCLLYETILSAVA